MAASSIGYGVVPISLHHSSAKYSQSLSFNSSSITLSPITLLPKLQFNSRAVLPPISAIQSNFFKVVQTAFKIGKDGIEGGTNLVPEAVPRPVAKISVAIVATALSLLVLRSFISTVFFSVGVMGFVYFVYLALNKDKGPKINEKPGSTDEAIDQANKIMDKYK
ncbi:uncharacterized protein LOC141598808 [Silene latifolia]|uniref:uncharacterized protein LOC141598808 n=1 Tax=Silene latifolia TaxID=37657 RepID=UPI003D76E68E